MLQLAAAFLYRKVAHIIQNIMLHVTTLRQFIRWLGGALEAATSEVGCE